MSRKFNFSAGPSTLPVSVLEEIRDDMVDYHNGGMSLIEASHRDKDYDEVHNRAVALVKELMGLPDNYQVLFLGGGATLQFSMIPMNFLDKNKSCDFTLTGTWSKSAYDDAKKIGNVNVVFDGAAEKYTKLPKASDVVVDSKSEYLHITSNETIGGIQWQEWPATGNVPIICDMSSDMMSRRVPVEKFGMIYAGAQKNLGPAGVTLAIIRDDLLAKANKNLTAYLDYNVHAKANSLYNTPPVFSIYGVKLVLEWIKANGGLEGMEKRADEKSSILYNAMKASNGYYKCPVPEYCQSKMNVVWRLPSEELEKKFISEASALGMVGLKGHRSVGGCRASIYNAMPVEGVQALANFMSEFAKNNK